MSNQVNVGNYDDSNQAFPGYLDWLDTVGLNGSGVIMANVDGGIQHNHPDLVNRMLPCTGQTCGGAATDEPRHSYGWHHGRRMALRVSQMGLASCVAWAWRREPTW